jgi:hypothetical protein
MITDAVKTHLKGHATIPGTSPYIGIHLKGHDTVLVAHDGSNIWRKATIQ